MTLYSWGNPRYFPRLPPPVRRYFDVDHDARVVADCHWQAEPWTRPTIIALHGLNGSSDAHYMRGIAAKAFARGMNVVRLNQRNCGDTEHLSAGLFHSGLTADAAHVIAELVAVDGLRAIAVAGYSLGGNLALKLAAEYGDAPPDALVGVAAVSPIIEIGECVKALEQPGNRLYQWNFVKDLKRRMRRKERFWPGRFDLSKLRQIGTVREFDEAYTAPYFGFARRRGLLPPRQRDAHRRAHPRPGARHHGRRRPVRPVAAVSRPEADGQPAHPDRASASTAAIAASSARPRPKTMATGQKIRSWSLSAPLRKSKARHKTSET